MGTTLKGFLHGSKFTLLISNYVHVFLYPTPQDCLFCVLVCTFTAALPKAEGMYDIACNLEKHLKVV